MILGTLFGILAYRCAYASILDPRYNYIPLPPPTKTLRFHCTSCSVSHPRPDDEDLEKSIVWSWSLPRRSIDTDELKELLWLQSLRRLNLWIDRGQKSKNESLILPEILNLPGPDWQVDDIGLKRRTPSPSRTTFKKTRSSHIWGQKLCLGRMTRSESFELRVKLCPCHARLGVHVSMSGVSKQGFDWLGSLKHLYLPQD